MQCPKCGGIESKCKDSRYKDHTVYRRRECLACGARFSTMEVSLESFQSMNLTSQGTLDAISEIFRKLQRVKVEAQKIVNILNE